ncbi:DUF2797 domain-containing protein [Raoultibacter timonensis]|uniref:DUF2797 domain-containing protein n=1 Tax=Raoultibacter timonensis TaxID=1907662 RepID=A0ABM7WG45_9ACTN|nr:DUF2797 domain-containing protein [Raoultibacter timonensis]BDE95208.1 hypothetical protein CE91St30_05410 [Raoultibacter timonensis]BDF49811.1 hypothetical protein CE91St31_05410 [Raoultibacter timonensis]
MGRHMLSWLGVGFDGPRIALDDLDEGTRTMHSIEGETFTIVKHPERFCVGAYNLMTQEREMCERRQELPDGYKETSCPACADKTGFNPSFYNGGGISAQQRAYNDTPHIVYLAYFSPRHLKVGITSAARGKLRLLEQGARSAMILKECESAYAAREWEAKLCSTQGIYESLLPSVKYRLLTTQTHDHAEASAIMRKTVRDTFGLEPTDPIDLDRYYSRDESVLAGSINEPDNPSSTMVAGECVGMVGTFALMRQQGRVYAASLKDYVSHLVDYRFGEVLYEYSAPPEQGSLF